MKTLTASEIANKVGCLPGVYSCKNFKIEPKESFLLKDGSKIDVSFISVSESANGDTTITLFYIPEELIGSDLSKSINYNKLSSSEKHKVMRLLIK